jgi:hypothetical protein
MDKGKCKMKLTTSQISQAWRFLRITALALLPLLVKENLLTGKWAIWAGVAIALLSGATEVIYRSTNVRPVIETKVVEAQLLEVSKANHPSVYTTPVPDYISPAIVDYPPLHDWVDNDTHQSPKGW